MADYYSILKKTIEGLPSNTPQVREAVYTKARAAIERQLRNIDPVPAEDVIASQLELLETAISTIDGEYAVPADATAEPETATPATMVETPPDSSPPIAEPVDAGTLTQPSAPGVDGDLAPPPSVPEPPSVDQVPPPPPDAVPSELSATTADQPVVLPSQAVEPPSAPVAVETPMAATPQPEPQPQQPPVQTNAPADAPEIGQADATDAILDKYAKKPGPSLFNRLVLPVIILVLLLAGGFGIWTNRDALSPMVTSLLGGGDSGQQNDQSNGDASVTVSDKEAVKLGANGEDETAQPIVTPEASTQDGADPSATQENEAGQAPAENPQQDEVAQTQETDQTQAEAAQTDNQPAVPLPPGETAYLYQEADGTSGVTKTDASVAWSVTQESPLTGFAEEPVITAKMSVPEKNLSMEMHMSRNVDETLSASHVIDMKFEVPAGFEHGSVDNVTRFVMKNTEEARGEPLVAVPVKVRDNQFLIALDNLEQAVQVNRQLLLSSNWIDINVTYADGKRGLLTLSKGAEGGAVFQNAFNDWANR